MQGGLVGDPDGLMDRIRKLFDIARRSVDAELAGTPAENNVRLMWSTQSVSTRPSSPTRPGAASF